MSWSDPGSDPMQDISDVIQHLALQEVREQSLRLEVLLAEAFRLQDLDKLDRLHICSFYDGSEPGVASYVRVD